MIEIDRVRVCEECDDEAEGFLYDLSGAHPLCGRHLRLVGIAQHELNAGCPVWAIGALLDALHTANRRWEDPCE